MLWRMLRDKEERPEIGLSHCKARAVTCSKDDISRFCSNEWLNDNIILLSIDLTLHLAVYEMKRSKLRVMDPLTFTSAIDSGNSI